MLYKGIHLQGCVSKSNLKQIKIFVKIAVGYTTVILALIFNNITIPMYFLEQRISHSIL